MYTGIMIIISLNPMTYMIYNIVYNIVDNTYLSVYNFKRKDIIMSDTTKEKFNPRKYLAQYTKEHYDRITITAPKGKKADVMEKAKSKGLSASQYILMALDYFERNS